MYCADFEPDAGELLSKVFPTSVNVLSMLATLQGTPALPAHSDDSNEASTMAKKIQRNKAATTQSEVKASSFWLAGVGALSLARKQGRALLGDFEAEGRRVQGDAVRFVRETRADTRAQITGWVTPARARLRKQAAAAGKAVENGIADFRARLGIPSKSDIDELTQRVATLSRQLKTVSST